MQRARLLLSALLFVVVAGCGGKQTPPPGSSPEGAPAAGAEPAAETEREAAPAEEASGLPAIPGEPASEPAPLFATLAIGDPAGLVGDVGGYVDAVVPGLGGQLDTELYGEVTREVLGARLEGIDYAQPMWALLLDPGQAPNPVVLVVGVEDGAALAKSAEAGGLAIQQHEGYAAVGARAALETGARYALSALPAKKAPRHPVATVYADKILERYRAQIQQVMPMIRAQLASSGAQSESALATLDGVWKLASQTDVLHASVELDGAASLVLRLVPKEDSEIAELFSGQPAASFDLVASQPEGMFFFGGSLDWESIGSVLEAVNEGTFEAAYGDAAAPMQEVMRETYRLLDGEVAMSGGLGPKDTLVFDVRSSVSDTEKLSQVVRKSLRITKKGKGGDFVFNTRPRAFRHRGVRVSSLSMKPAKSLPPEKRAGYEKVWGEGSVTSFFAIFDGVSVVAAGAGSKKRVRAAITQIKKKAEPSPPAAREKAISTAKSRKESLLFLADVAALAKRLGGGGAGLKAGGDPLALAVGFDGGELSLRFTLPPDQARAFQALNL